MAVRETLELQYHLETAPALIAGGYDSLDALPTTEAALVYRPQCCAHFCGKATLPALL